MPSPAISLICTTVGRPKELGRLLQSVLTNSSQDEIEFILVDQGKDQASTRVLTEMTLPGPVRATTTGRGASLGRNVGICLSTADIVTFPNDNCWYPADTIKIGRASCRERV